LKKSIRRRLLEIASRIGTDGSEKQYSDANPPTWDKSERADNNLPDPQLLEKNNEET
jgi:hypothetical protein